MKYLITSIFILLFHISSFSQVTMRDTTIQWQHFDYELNQYYGLKSYSSSDIVTTSFQGIVLENELVKICLIPEYGARIISFIYKPTGKEQLYQNPIGTPYGINEGNFYHNWLMVYGGIFPTFPEPEHGKYWNTPWKSEITVESPDKITVAMSQLDTLSNPQRPGQYGGLTGITCRFDVSLAANQPYFTIDVELENDATGDDFEYWTCITFAPGSESGNTFTPGNSEMIVPIEQYKMGWNPNNWMAGLDEVIQTNGEYIMAYDKLAHLSNWEDMGIAYAHPILEEPYYGVITHDNEHGLFRLSNDQSATPGLKFWTWGNENGLNTNPNEFGNSARPYIELWSGVSKEFFQKKFLDAHEKINFTETYLPTVGLAAIDYLSDKIAFSSNLDGSLLQMQSFYPVAAGTFRLGITIEQNGEEVHAETRNITAQTAEAADMLLDLDMLSLEDEMAQVTVALFQNNEQVHSQNYSYQNAILATGSQQLTYDPELYVKNQAIHLGFKNRQSRQVMLYDMNGQVLASNLSEADKLSIPYKERGVYIVQVIENEQMWTKKIAVQ